MSFILRAVIPLVVLATFILGACLLEVGLKESAVLRFFLGLSPQPATGAAVDEESDELQTTTEPRIGPPTVEALAALAITHSPALSVPPPLPLDWGGGEGVGGVQASTGTAGNTSSGPRSLSPPNLAIFIGPEEAQLTCGASFPGHMPGELGGCNHSRAPAATDRADGRPSLILADRPLAAPMAPTTDELQRLPFAQKLPFLALVVATCFASDLFSPMSVPFLPGECARRGLSESVVGGLAAAYPCGVVVGAPCGVSLACSYDARLLLRRTSLASSLILCAWGLLGHVSIQRTQPTADSPQRTAPPICTTPPPDHS